MPMLVGRQLGMAYLLFRHFWPLCAKVIGSVHNEPEEIFNQAHHMIIRSSSSGFLHPVPSDITPQAAYQSRRDLMRQLAAGSAGVALAGWGLRDAQAQMARPGQLPPLAAVPTKLAGAVVMDKPTPYKDAATYNNFYEFGTDKADPAKRAHTLVTDPWSVEIEGLVKKPARVNLEDLLKWGAMEERIYRLRCVEGWSMVIPWVGYSLADLIRRVEPLPGAKFVEFVTQADPKTMPGLRSSVIDWPYVEGLRMDEAMHPLTLLAFGMYGEVMPKQNGAPLRLVVPWKYGFKSSKSLVKIRFTDKQPVISWEKSAPQEYGFYSNVNPNVDHPRWSQATERRIGEDGLLAKKRKTLMFNGYEAQVGQLYAGMDLKKFF
jgi:sulfoxide reductase catalytic subunit YedY